MVHDARSVPNIDEPMIINRFAVSLLVSFGKKHSQLVHVAKHKSSDVVTLDGRIVTAYHGSANRDSNPPVKVDLYTIGRPDEPAGATSEQSVSRKQEKDKAVELVKKVPYIDDLDFVLCLLFSQRCLQLMKKFSVQ